jgi:hypothetical protein
MLSPHPFRLCGTLDDLATIPPDVHIYVRSVRGDSSTERGEFELSGDFANGQ